MDMLDKLVVAAMFVLLFFATVPSNKIFFASKSRLRLWQLSYVDIILVLVVIVALVLIIKTRTAGILNLFITTTLVLSLCSIFTFENRFLYLVSLVSFMFCAFSILLQLYTFAYAFSVITTVCLIVAAMKDIFYETTTQK